MKTKIYCEVMGKGEHSFYLKPTGECYYLFSQNYRKGVQEYYKNGVFLDDLFVFSKSRNDDAVKRTMSKIPMYIKYLEREYDLLVKKIINKKCAIRAWQYAI